MTPSSSAQLEAVAARRLEADVAEALAGPGPVVFGPWRGEVGYEVLYWVPFLRYLCARFDLDPAAGVAFSRGGVASWYANIAEGYVDIFELVSPETFRARLEAEWSRAGGQKQGELTDFDRDLLDSVRERLGPHRLIHPSLMFRVFERVWKGGASMGHVLRHTDYARWNAPVDEILEGLPERYVAAKFYFRGSFPDTEANRSLVESALRRLSASAPLVLLDTGLELDDHREAELGASHVLRPLAGVPAPRNLHAQSAIVGQAEAFVGTYGGFSYLAPAYGVRSVALASDASELFPTHLDVVRRAAAAAGASFTFLDAASLSRLPSLSPA